MIYTPFEIPYQIITKYVVLGIIWSDFQQKKFKKPFFHINPKMFLMKKVNNVKSAYLSHTHFILTLGYQRGLVQNLPNFAILLILKWTLRKTIVQAETKKSIFFIRRVYRTVSLSFYLDFFLTQVKIKLKSTLSPKMYLLIKKKFKGKW